MAPAAPGDSRNEIFRLCPLVSRFFAPFCFIGPLLCQALPGRTFNTACVRTRRSSLSSARGEHAGPMVNFRDFYWYTVQLRTISLYGAYRDQWYLESLALNERFSLLRQIALSALAHLHSLHLVLWIISHSKFSLLFEISRTSWGDGELNCRRKIVCSSVFHAEWMWAMRKGTATNENLCEIVRSLSFANASGMRNVHLVSLGNKKASCGTTAVDTCTWSVNRKPPISIRANIYWRVMCLGKIRL